MKIRDRHDPASPTPSPRPALVPVRRSKEVYGWSTSTTYRLAAAGKLKLVKVGRGRFTVDATARPLIGE